MNKFYGIVGLAVLSGLALVIFAGTTLAEEDITFNDLETECRVGEDQEAHFQLTQDNTLKFEGHYPIENRGSEVSSSFTKSSDTIRLQVDHSEGDEPEDFEHDCLGSVVYEAESGEIETGSYLFEIVHDGEVVKRNIITVR